MAADNKMLGQFDLMGIPPAPRGVPQVEVTFDIDANGIVSRHGEGQGDQQGTADPHPGFGRAVGRRHQEDGARKPKAHAAEDKKRRALAEAKNQADALVHSTEKALGEHGGKIDAAETHAPSRTPWPRSRKPSRATMSRTIQAKTQALAQASMKLGEAMYKAQQAAKAATALHRAATAQAAKDDNVVDAEFAEVDENKERRGIIEDRKTDNQGQKGVANARLLFRSLSSVF